MKEQFPPIKSSQIDPQRLAQLVKAARVAQQVRQAAAMMQSGERQQSPEGEPMPSSVLPATDPFTAAYGFGSAVPQGSLPPPERIVGKIGAIQRARQAQAGETTDANRDAGNFIRVGQRPLLPGYPADLWYHTYLEIPRFRDGKFTGEFDNYGVLGDWDEKKNEGTSRNQQVSENDRHGRNGPKEHSNRNKVYEVPVTPEQREALREGAKYWSNLKQPHQCPSCGSHYIRGGPFSGPAYNSNTWVYNMLIHNPAGRIEPPAAINKKDAPGWAVNDVGRNYYPH